MNLHDRIMNIDSPMMLSGVRLIIQGDAAQLAKEGDARIAELEAALASAEQKRQNSIRAARKQWLGQGGELVRAVALENERLRECLKEARENLEDWGMYASEYFRDKHGIAEDLAAIDKVLGGGDAH